MAWKAKWRRIKPANLTGVFTTLVTRDDISEAISKINLPALVIHGAADVAIELHRSEAMRAALPGALPMVVVEGAGHAANLTHPAPVNEAIINFMEALGA